MNLILMLTLLFGFSLPAQSTANKAADPALSAKIESLFQTVLATDDESKEALAVSQAQDVYTQRGLPTISEVGELPAYEFVVLLASKRQPLGFRNQALAKVREASASQDIPSDAASLYEARLRLDKTVEGAKTRPPTNPALRDQIEDMFKVDQAVRQQKGFDRQKLEQTDQQNTAPLQAILNKYGVPTFSMVGPQAAGDFIAMIQHQAPAFRKQVLPRLKANVAAGQADPQSYALVYDRSQSDVGEKQLYGENLVCSDGEKMHEAPIEDEPHVNQRRAELGLIRMELYVRLVAETLPQFCQPVETTK